MSAAPTDAGLDRPRVLPIATPAQVRASALAVARDEPGLVAAAFAFDVPSFYSLPALVTTGTVLTMNLLVWLLAWLNTLELTRRLSG